MIKNSILCLSSVILLNSCATIFMPRKQKVTFNTGSSDSEVYLDNNMIGEGETFTIKLPKNGGDYRQLIIKREGCKDQYSALIKTHRPPAYYPLAVLNIANLYYGMLIDASVGKNKSFDKIINLENEDNKLVNKGIEDKYLNISNIKLNIKDYDKDIVEYFTSYNSKNVKEAMETAELKKENRINKLEAKEKKKNKGKQVKTLEKEKKEIKYDDTKFSYNVYQTLKKTGFVDTINKVFNDNNNTLVLEAGITQIHIFYLYNKFAGFYKTKVSLTWYVKNTYDEILDSVVTTEFSGEFIDKHKDYLKMIGDAIDISYIKLHQNPALTKYLKIENDFKSQDPILTIKSAKSKITDKVDAALACVTVKLQEGKKDVGHGSGFAISEDGYIITNYHVVAGTSPGKYKNLTVINSDGEQMAAQVIRVNKYRDLALIKVEGKFEKGFTVSNVKSFKKMQDVYTIGTPKEIELGQSVQSGIISNERKTETTDLIQLGMSVNSGNSGGPLFDLNGNLHGIIVSKLVGTNTEGVSFAVPAYLIPEYLNINFK